VVEESVSGVAMRAGRVLRGCVLKFSVQVALMAHHDARYPNQKRQWRALIFMVKSIDPCISIKT
jgi:hypothetical protein